MERYRYNPIERTQMEKSVVPFAVYQFLDKRVVTILLSQGFFELFGYENSEKTYELMNNNMYRDVHLDDVARISDSALRFAVDGGEYNVVYRTMKKGEYHIIHAFGRHFNTAEGVRLAMVWYVDEGLYVGNDIVHDDSLERNFSISLYEASLNRKSNFDALTGLPNMTYFFELAKAGRIRAHEESKHCSLCFANLNGMRYYNKKYGFAEGDKLLRLFADLLIKYFGSENSGRIAQDSFAFFALSDHLDKSIENLFMEFGVMTGKRGASVRIGIYPDTMGVVETSLACDRAKYACNTIQNTNYSQYVRFDNTMLEFESNRQYVIDHLDQALEEGWIQAYFQAIVRTANGCVSDEEALARWIDPVRGMLSPAEFIPIIEDAKLIYKVDLHMVDLILKKMKAQELEGHYIVPTSVNLSRTDFDACDMVSEICTRVDAAGISRSLITIEITESVIGSDFDFMKKQVERFRKLGFHVWMDDFGSGYSSLDVLQSIHFDVIKLDMRFMKQFDNDEKSRVIITELMKMAIGLGIETVCEGVERADQVEFLAEIGCTRLQGYYYCKPIPMDEIFRRYREGRQIGFENPEESAYFEAIGRINLYDASSAVSETETSGNQYFNTFPMAILGVRGSEMRIIRSNKSYRTFMSRIFQDLEKAGGVNIRGNAGGRGSAVEGAIRKCAESGERVFINERITSDTTVHALIIRIASNPVTGMTACNIIILGIIKDTGQGVTYADIANSLSSDYIYLYYVNLETEAFTEYRHMNSESALVVERHGTEFFAASQHDAREIISPDDLDQFLATFTKEKVIKAMDEHGAFKIIYRMLIEGVPEFVHMKAVRMTNNPGHIIIGVSNVNAQMRAEEDLKQLKEERITFSRLSSLAGNNICVYIVNPADDSYLEYTATSDYDGLNLAKKGDDFFNRSREESKWAIYSTDQERFREMFTKERVMGEIEKYGVYVINYRLMIDGVATYVCLKAAKVNEVDGPRLIIGVSDVDAQARRDVEYMKRNNLRIVPE